MSKQGWVPIRSFGSLIIFRTFTKLLILQLPARLIGKSRYRSALKDTTPLKEYNFLPPFGKEYNFISLQAHRKRAKRQQHFCEELARFFIQQNKRINYIHLTTKLQQNNPFNKRLYGWFEKMKLLIFPSSIGESNKSTFPSPFRSVA